MLLIFFMGFSSGLPLLLVGGTLQAWMKDTQVDLSIIGLFSLVGLPYTLKFLWAPFMDRFIPFKLGRRRSWMLLTQAALVVSLFFLSLLNPAQTPFLVAGVALILTFFSASQDIVLDAYRREFLKDEELGLGSSFFVNGYRIGMIVAGAFALFLADQIAWSLVYKIMAAFMGVGILITFISPEPKVEAVPPKSLREAVIDPFKDYFLRSNAWVILFFILLYKLGDSMASSMTTPFILDLGFSKTDMATIAKTFGLIATIVGGFVGGALMLRMSVLKSLWYFGFLQMVSTAGFALLAWQGKNIITLTAVVAFENFSAGLGTVAYGAFMASLCNKKFTATQFALLSSLMGIPRVIFSAPTGYLVQSFGWSTFFIFCTLIALPGMLLLFKIAPAMQEKG